MAGIFRGRGSSIARALAIYEKALGPEHPVTNRARYNLVACPYDGARGDEWRARSPGRRARSRSVPAQGQAVSSD
jgi:hypothetical protein